MKTCQKVYEVGGGHSLLSYHTDLRIAFMSSRCGSRVSNLTSIHEDVCSIPGLTQWVKGSGVAVAVV